MAGVTGAEQKASSICTELRKWETSHHDEAAEAPRRRENFERKYILLLALP